MPRACSLSREKVSIPLDKDGTSLRAYFTHMVKATRFGGSDQFFLPFFPSSAYRTRASIATLRQHDSARPTTSLTLSDNRSCAYMAIY